MGDLFQQYAAKYIGIGRGIPLSNTNQLWGLAWGALVFGELAGARSATLILVLAGSAVMIGGALAIAGAAAPASEQAARSRAVARECHRYGLDLAETEAALEGESTAPSRPGTLRWDALIALAALGVFVWLGWSARRPALSLHLEAMAVLVAGTLAALALAGFLLWRRTRFV